MPIQCCDCKNKATKPGMLGSLCLKCKWQYPGQEAFDRKHDYYEPITFNSGDKVKINTGSNSIYNGKIGEIADNSQPDKGIYEVLFDAPVTNNGKTVYKSIFFPENLEKIES